MLQAAIASAQRVRIRSVMLWGALALQLALTIAMMCYVGNARIVGESKGGRTMATKAVKAPRKPKEGDTSFNFGLNRKPAKKRKPKGGGS